MATGRCFNSSRATMARKKVKLAWIANDSTRRATFKKRRKGLMKKASELGTLCDVKVCVIVYAPQEPPPEVWPSVTDATCVLARFKRMPETEQSKKMVNQEAFLLQRVAKLREQLRKQKRENLELETSMLMRRGLTDGAGLCEVELEAITSLAWMVEAKVKLVRERMEQVIRNQRILIVGLRKAEEERPSRWSEGRRRRQRQPVKCGVRTRKITLAQVRGA
ncbi:agamous-like MADS-box protein AGL80 [Zingiber officinale]|uniref:MADS-box domain-containing protein n=1 Tax=Zingiber officinale TaxID=94328 RepID=A0A8J5HUX3_ZINOF|nr:agamous-like MADS-box protein AGL80 [Zingiber officinale]KAG6533933.1 hypothetical protein ZIOFF_007812 [Zingiber officinale]